jgi:hypothetical protein
VPRPLADDGPAGSWARGFALDAERHRRDAPRHCPWCGAAFGEAGLVVEYWAGAQRIFSAWCRACGAAAEVVRVERVVGHEAE